MISFLMLGTALATGIRFEELPCPHGEGTVRKFYKVSSNALGGYDSDLAVYSTRGQFREHAISTCPSSYYSALGSDLDRVITEGQRDTIDAAIAQSRANWKNPDNPMVWERYATAAQIASAVGRNALDISELYLNAAWTVRDAAVGVYVGGLEGPQAARQILDLGNTELAKDLTPEAMKLLRYNLARVAHRGGFSTERDRHIGAFLSLKNLTPEETQAGARMRALSQTVEPQYQRAAVMTLQAAVANTVPGQRRSRALYQLADTQRRLGDFRAAAVGFQSILKDPDAPSELKEMASFLLEEIGK